MQLADTEYRSAYYGQGPPSAIGEAYEMIPFVSTKEKPTTVKIIGGGALGNEPVSATGVIIDRSGYGVRVEFDQPRPVKLGKTETVLIQLVNQRTSPEQVGFKYTLVPYVGE